MKHIALILGLILSGTVASTAASAHSMVMQFFGVGAAGELTQATSDRVEDLAYDRGIDLTDFACFELELRKLASGKRIGTGVDCLHIDKIAEDGDFVELTAHSFFLMRGRSGFVSSGLTTVRAFRPGTGNGDRGDGAGPITHMTGSLPDDNTIYGGSGRFADAVGSARLSGAVDLTDFDPLDDTKNSIFFNCIFVVDMGSAKHSKGRHHKRRHDDDDDDDDDDDEDDDDDDHKRRHHGDND